MAGITVHYLLVYNFAEQKLEDIKQFREGKKARVAYAQAESDYAGRSDEFEVVLVGADSLETVVKTHGHYFSKVSPQSMFSDLLTEPVASA